MARTIAFIDGFNVYHALVEQRGSGRSYAQFRWLNYWRLAEQFLHTGDTLAAVYLFTAFVAWRTPSGKAKRQRHCIYLRALEDTGVTVVLGRFRPVTRECKAACGQKYKTYEEKRTDVNIAIHMLELASHRTYDKAMIVSGDSDLIPAIEAVRRADPSIKVTVVVPIKRKALALRNEADYFREMRRSHLEKSRFPDPLILSDGTALAAPPGWT